MDNTLVDSVGAYAALTQVGTVNMVTTPAPTTGTYFAGTYTSSNYFILPADLGTTVASDANGGSFTLELENLRFSDVTTTQVFLAPLNSAGGIFYVSGGILYWGSGGASPTYMGLGTAAINTNYKVRCSYDGVSRKAWVNGVTATPNLVAPAFGNVFYIGLAKGRSGGDLPSTAGYMSRIRFMSVALQDNAPIVDPATAPSGNRSMPILDQIRLKLGSLLNLFATPLYAIEQDGPEAAKINQENYISTSKKFRATEIRKLFLAGKVTATPTPPEGIPTRTVTATATPTPGKVVTGGTK
jgi:hypothetical protein